MAKRKTSAPPGIVNAQTRSVIEPSEKMLSYGGVNLRNYGLAAWQPELKDLEEYNLAVYQPSYLAYRLLLLYRRLLSE
jgi:hypothetical protein